MESERTPLLGSRESREEQSCLPDPVFCSTNLNLNSATRTNSFRPYKRRWWIIFVFALCTTAQSAQWNTWSPIADAVEIGYSWDPSLIAIFPASANAAFIVFGLLIMYLVETQGLRAGAVVGVCLTMSTVAFWNIALALELSWVIIFGSIFNGMSAIITMAVPPLVSSVWFPLSERTTATAIASMSGYIGTSLSFLSGPYISGANVTADDVKNRLHLPESFKESLRVGIQRVVYFDTGLAVLCFACVLVYYPAKPPTPPTKTAGVEREDFWHGMKDLVRNWPFVILNLAYNLPNGTLNSWLPLVSVNFRPLGISEDVAAWIGFTSMITACVASVMMSFLVDCFKRVMKRIMVVMSVLSIVCVAILLCVQESYIYVPPEHITAVLYILCISTGISVNGVIPLYYEMSCETAYPVHEGLTCLFLTIVNNIIGMVYFLLLSIPGLGDDTQWMTWVALGAMVCGLPLLLMFRENFRRLDIDESYSFTSDTS